jgi:hypothetical protein
MNGLYLLINLFRGIAQTQATALLNKETISEIFAEWEAMTMNTLNNIPT